MIFLLAALPAFPVAKEILQLQRDVAQLQDQVSRLEKSLGVQLGVMQQLLSQSLDASARLSNSLSALERTVQGQEKVLAAPVAGVNAKVDSLAERFQALREAVDEMNTKLRRLETQVVDIKNIVSTVPPPAAPAGGTTPSSTPPAPQVQAETLYRNAMRDYTAGNYNLAGPQFDQYIKLFGNTDLAADAQYYLGDILYQSREYEKAVDAFDQVLERYTEGKQTPNAQYKKGLALFKLGKRDKAAQEFRGVISKFPGTPAAAQAAEALRGMGLSARPSAAPAKKSRRK
ncbi:MAG: tetratricopeptide repeat protein [Acidobacteria bacterium]|nr:tetratricopeptide repeat protein [Acidobacteriota bacterium]